ncbi:MAG: M36 family metallopeptidase [Gaiellaceae bacterium]
MKHTAPRGWRFALALAVTLGAFTVTGVAAADDDHGRIQGEQGGLKDVDARKGKREPSARQKELAAAGGVQARWNEFGTPQALASQGRYIATGLSSDPVAAAREWIAQNRDLLRLSEQGVRDLELVNAAPIGAGSAVLLRQTFDGVSAGHDGLISVGVVEGKIAYVSSSLTGDAGISGVASITPQAAVIAAAANIGRAITASDISVIGVENGWTLMSVNGFSDLARARLGAVPTPQNGVRLAWETFLLDNAVEPLAASHFIDAQTTELLIRENLVDHAADNPTWKVFPANPPLDYSSSDTRELWCWNLGAPGCVRAVADSSQNVPWDTDAVTGTPTFTTMGNNARAAEDWFNASPFSIGPNTATPSPMRDYQYAWTNQWFNVRCNPAAFTSPQRNDIDAADANLFAMHNRMHDWSYHLGFTEANFNMQTHNYGRGGLGGDPERGQVQDGGVVGGPPGFAARDNANQVTPADGIGGITNMYLWQPIAGSFYAPCVDGDYDMSVIGHEYTHAISNRMVAGPAAGLSGPQGGAMGESWSDLAAMEYLNSNGFVPIAGENPYAVGPYVTGDHQAGIRNYGMNASPLNYSDIGYDVTGPQVHADGEIWSATNFAIRSALIGAYGAGSPALQQSCNAGATPASACPGNRRWIQLVFDAWLLMAAGNVSMVDARDAMLAADLVRFGGANQALLWNEFAARGLGEGASSNTNADPDPKPSFESPYADEAVVTFKAVGDADGSPVQLFVGRYEARATPIADTDPATPLSATFRIVPGTYEFVARGNGFGAARFTAELKPAQVRDLPVNMPRNLASSTSGATATGDGVNQARLIDDTEATNWASLSGAVAGKQVTVRFDPAKPAQQVARVQVSALVRPNINDPNDPGGQNRFSALRQFEILTCEAKGAVDCTQDSQFTLIFTSPADAFPAIVPRPRAPELIYRSWDVPKTKATHIRLRVVHNQCTGTPAYQGDQDDDPANSTDCDETTLPGFNLNAFRVRASELQVFAQ